MEAIAGLLALIGIVGMLISSVSVLWPLKRLGLPTRKRSALALLLSFWVIMTGGALVPDKPPAQALDHAEPEPAPQTEAPSDPPPQVETAASPQEPPTPPDPNPQPSAQRGSALGLYRIDGENNVGCRDRDYYGKLTRFAVQGDTEAFNQALMAGGLSGACVMFKAGAPVFIIGSDMSLGLWQVRRKGEITEYWTTLKAVTR